MDFVTDSYLPLSIKGIERQRRGSSQPHLIRGSLTKVPRDWKQFLRNEENKTRLTHFLLGEWKGERYTAKLKGRRVFFVCENKCFCLSSNGKDTVCEEVDELNSTQEEADTKIIVHCLNIAATSPPDLKILIRSPDTDVFAQICTRQKTGSSI